MHDPLDRLRELAEMEQHKDRWVAECRDLHYSWKMIAEAARMTRAGVVKAQKRFVSKRKIM